MDFARTFGPSKSQPWASQAAFWSEFRPKPGRRILEKAEDCLRQVRDSPLRMQRVTSSCLHVRAPTVTAWRHAPGRRIDHDAIATAVVKIQKWTHLAVLYDCCLRHFPATPSRRDYAITDGSQYEINISGFKV
eukprot:s15850_g1.t4